MNTTRYQPPFDPTKVDRVITHGGCADGKAAAWPFWRVNKIRYQAGTFKIDEVVHGQPPPDVTGQFVVITDFCYPAENLRDMAEKAKALWILDHHKSAERDVTAAALLPNVKYIFDATRSGAQIAWDVLNGEGTPRPFFVDLIADRDLWEWKLPFSKEINKALSSRGYYTWENMENLAHLEHGVMLDNFLSSMKEHGKVICEQEDKDIAAACSNAVLTAFKPPTKFQVVKDSGGLSWYVQDPVKTYSAYLTSGPKHLRSEICNRLLDNHPKVDIAAMWQYDFATNEWWVSCRSRKSDSVDLSEICSKFERGGGHASAAGFTIFGTKCQDLYTYFTPIVTEQL